MPTPRSSEATRRSVRFMRHNCVGGDPERVTLAQGHALWVTPDAVVAHEAHASTSRLGGTGRRHYIGSLIRILEETEPPLKLKLFKLVILLQNLTLLTLHRSRALSMSEMRG